MQNLQKTLETLENTFTSELLSADSLEMLETIRIAFLGRKGHIAELMPLLKNFSDEQKRTFGPQLNTLKETIEKKYQEKKKALYEQLIEQKEAEHKDFDVTAYKAHQATGSLHLYTHATEKIMSLFSSMGYQIVDGQEVDTEEYNFEALNIPKNHPARDMQDTFWLDVPHTLLRTQTSNMQIHIMKEQKPPIALISTGRVYRYEATDASHDYMFRQVEGLVVDKNISMADLLGTMQLFLQEYFEKKDLTIRSRPGYFPFVEPGIELDMSCPFCKEGCSVCKRTGWIEIAGAGLVHPNVFKACSIDPTEYTGFAFGFGLTRMVMLKHKINDIRLLHSAQIDFLKQF